MKRKRLILLLSCLCLFVGGSSSSLFFSQEKDIQLSSYNPAGRRDPFRDLLGGRDAQKPAYVEGVPQIYIDDVVLVGIVRARGELTAIINSDLGFPYYIKEGEKFADGFVRLIEDSRVIFSKTHERGIPLREPKDVIKEIYPQEQ